MSSMLGGRYRSDIRYQAPLLVSYPISAGFISENIGYGTDMVRPRDGPYLFHIRYETRRDRPVTKTERGDEFCPTLRAEKWTPRCV